MTSERWCPEPYDDMPYGALDASDPNPPHGQTAGSDASSVSVPASVATAGGPAPAEALPLLEICPVCLTEVDDWYFCSTCGRQLPLRGEATASARPSVEDDAGTSDSGGCDGRLAPFTPRIDRGSQAPIQGNLRAADRSEV